MLFHVIFVSVMSCILVFSTYIFFRNRWVYKKSVDKIEERYLHNKKLIADGTYDEKKLDMCIDNDYGSYEHILFTFWEWNFEKFYKQKK